MVSAYPRGTQAWYNIYGNVWKVIIFKCISVRTLYYITLQNCKWSKIIQKKDTFVIKFCFLYDKLLYFISKIMYFIVIFKVLKVSYITCYVRCIVINLFYNALQKGDRCELRPLCYKRRNVSPDSKRFRRTIRNPLTVRYQTDYVPRTQRPKARVYSWKEIINLFENCNNKQYKGKKMRPKRFRLCQNFV